jgi:cyclopropane-fatty-acyl-phospholipid synthase
MFEHVGRKNYDEFFACVRDRLADDGVALLHTISHFSEPHQMNAYIRKHIFPGADVPAISEIMAPIQRSGLFVTDVEILRLHYAETLMHWSHRFAAHEAKITKLYGDNFYRKWMFYLVSCETAFRHGCLMVAQVQLSKRLGTVPLTRDYMYEAEHANFQKDRASNAATLTSVSASSGQKPYATRPSPPPASSGLRI